MSGSLCAGRKAPGAWRLFSELIKSLAMSIPLYRGNKEMVLNRKTVRQWRAVVREEGGTRGWLPLVLGMAWQVASHWRTAWKVLKAPSLWRSRYRKCRACPIFDKRLRRCRPYTCSPLGCGCYVPFMIFFKRHCWGKEHFARGIGW